MKFLVFGDSHTTYFNITESMRGVDSNLRGVNSIVKTIGGSTISGFGKRESTLNTLHAYKKAYELYKPDYIVFALGQVDLELGYYYRWFVKQEKPDFNEYITGLASSLVAEVSSIAEIYDLNLSQLLFKGVNLSVLTYDRALAVKYTTGIIAENLENVSQVEGVKKEMLSYFPSNLERRNMHLRFNDLIKSTAIKAGMKYFDINEEITDESSLHVRREFVPAKYDHHLVDSLDVRLIHVRKLLNTIYGC
ncbi:MULTISPECIES: hypothetical protein [unclassified Halomonas]|uniref:SGNH/GDSL hydrolase family protein n=1 Tax=unclassified Halomonas TaxID=2609666 RepID=UPI001EF47B68|nr:MULTISPECIES: hypothetical protein [unclassified Halomonas]MCG7577214.1 hypothetical protein [Halomonas sp. MMH1-48]MCG7604279.1 hypothetical protein [Halomonas sp. MM17-34]MCG7613528.1 hypothetical protein [Halomonas sp. MM17-29]MCG7620302.1 hypothetical protein [Halomonas sp. DSH1-27]|tara:strand:- start:2832 stop:3578 length:747 start_codon:yes stop_codon:yes gene_type:complete